MLWLRLAQSSALTGEHASLNATQDYPPSYNELLHRMKNHNVAGGLRNWCSRARLSFGFGNNHAEVAQVPEKMKIHSLTVIANAINIANRFGDAPGISLIMIGGVLRPVSAPS